MAGQYVRSGRFARRAHLACECCGAQFAGRADRRYCSRSCSSRSHRHTDETKAKLSALKSGVPLTAEHRENIRQSMLRSERVGLFGPANPAFVDGRSEERRKARKLRRAALKRGAENSELIIDREVFERDGWQCGICLEPVDPELKFPDRMSASLDHKIPLARGGMHMLDNVQCAHWLCNVRKQDKVA